VNSDSSQWLVNQWQRVLRSAHSYWQPGLADARLVRDSRGPMPAVSLLHAHYL
jgi:hypothetical protein